MSTPMSSEGYAATGGTVCPHCGMSTLALSRLGFVGGHVLQHVSCMSCLAFWENVYELSGYEALEGPQPPQEAQR